MKKVLIAEDDRLIAQAYKTKLEAEGAEVKIADDGAMAMKLLEEFDPDVIVLDLVMPKQDGYETLKILKDSSKYRKIRVIVASNLSQEDEMKKAKTLGAEEFLIKSDTSIDKMAKMVLG